MEPKNQNFDNDLEYDDDDELFALGNQSSGQIENFHHFQRERHSRAVQPRHTRRSIR